MKPSVTATGIAITVAPLPNCGTCPTALTRTPHHTEKGEIMTALETEASCSGSASRTP
jgi:hypothetical protein